MKSGKYELVIAPPDYPGKRYRDRYCYEHQLVWWQHTGELVPKGFLIHHKNDNKRDNRIENLEKLDVSTHTALHNAGIELVFLICSFCGTSFSKEAKEARHKQNKGQKDFYCDRFCMGKHFGRSRSK